MLVVLGAQLVHMFPDARRIAAPAGGLVDLFLVTIMV